MSGFKFSFAVIVSAVALSSALGCGGDGNTGEDDGNIPDVIVVDFGGNDTNVGTDTNVDEDTAGTDTNVGEDTAGTDTNVGEDTVGTDTNVGEDANVGEDTVGTDTNVGEDTNVDEDTAGTDTNVGDDTYVPDCDAGQTIADLIALTEGTVDMTLCGVMVTKISTKGWWIADDSTTRGMYIYEGSNPDWGYTVAVGDYVTMHVTGYGNFQNTQQITAKDAPVVNGHGDASAYVIDLSAGTVPDESIESRVVRIDGVEVTSENGKSGTIDYGTATGVLVYVDYSDIPCVGLVADVVSGVVTQFNSQFQIKVTEESDLTNVKLDGCVTEPTYNMANWTFEMVDVEEDPPEGFKKGTGNTYTCVRQATGGASGTAGIEITWTSTENQDLTQGYMFPTNPGETVMFSLDVLDNDPAGRARLGLAFYDATKTFISGSNSWMVDGSNNAVYSVDSPSWQTLEWQAVAPANAAFATGTFRMYDDTAAWDGNATVTIDNWEMISVAP